MRPISLTIKICDFGNARQAQQDMVCFSFLELFRQCRKAGPGRHLNGTVPCRAPEAPKPWVVCAAHIDSCMLVLAFWEAVLHVLRVSARSAL